MKFSWSIIIIFIIIATFQSVSAQNVADESRKIPICNAAAISLPKPDYPRPSGRNVSGVVNVQILVNEQGNVVSANAISGHPLLRPGAERAALKAKFELATIKINCILAYNFVQEESEQIKEDSQEISEPAVISLGILNNRAIYLPQPEYPKEILQPHSIGDVYVQIKINLQEGKVVSATAVSGNPVFKKYAEEAALQAKFQPKQIEGSPLFAIGILVYKYPLEGKENEDSETKKVLPIIVGGVVNKRAKYLPKPVYPKSCRCAGTIKVQIVVDESGNVIAASTDSGNPLLRISAVEAARRTKFAPTLINGGGRIFVVAFLIYNFDSDGRLKSK